MGAGQAASGLAIAMVPPFAVWLMGMFGWRGTYFVIGLAVMTIGIPVSRWLVLDPPVIAHRTAADVPGLNFRDALRSRVFWLLAVSIFLVGAAASGGMMNLSLMLVERGASPQNASFILSLLGMTMIVARLGCGALFDRMNGRTLTALICAIVGSAFVVLALRSDTQGVMIAAVLIGIGFGAEGDALSYMASRAFGMRAFGTVFGTIFLAYTGGGTLGSVVFPLMHAQTGSYQAAIWSAAAACAVATILVLMIRDKDLPFMVRDARNVVDADDAMLVRA